jgi:hypothetical protein
VLSSVFNPFLPFPLIWRQLGYKGLKQGYEQQQSAMSLLLEQQAAAIIVQN